MNKKLLHGIAAVTTLTGALFTTSVSANTTHGYVSPVVTQANFVSFTMSSGSSDCSSGRWVIDTSSTNGQAMLASLLTALATHRDMTVGGTGACSTSLTDSETVIYIAVY